MGLRERIRRVVEARRAVPRPEDVRRLEQRLEHLEAELEGLQDAVHRDSIRNDDRMAELERRMQPEALAKALSEDARKRGL